MVQVGAIFTPAYPPESLREAALAAEAAGIPELWLWEDCFRESAMASMAAVLAWTERLRVGIGIAPMPLRNVATTAMELATIERLFPGRLLPGMGPGVLSWMEQVGARASSPLTLMREYIPALRALLAGEEVTFTGQYVALDRVRLDWPPIVPPPVYTAAGGPRMLQMSGEVADGTVIAAGVTPESATKRVAIARAAHEASGKPGRHTVVIYLMTVFGRDGAARAAAGMERMGVSPEERVYAAGDPAQVAEAVARYAASGIDSVLLQPVADDPDLGEFMAGAGEVVRLLG